MQKLFSYCKYFIGWPIALLALIFIGKLILNKGQSLTSLKTVNLPIIGVSVVFFILYFFFRALLWKKILETKGKHLSYKSTTYLWGLAELKRYVPGNIWSIIGRTVSFHEQGIEKSTLFSAMLIEAQLIILGSIFFSLFAVFFMLQEISGVSRMGEIFFLINFLFLILFSCFLFSKRIASSLRQSRIKFLRFIVSQTSVIKNFQLFLYALLPLFCFGLGMYFAASSIARLDVMWIKEYIGFFIFALFAGYISLITPVGLGVREGVIIFFLSKTLTLSTAGIVALFSRIVFIIGELFFLLLIYLWKQVKVPFVSKSIIAVQKYWHEIIVFLSAGIYALYFTTASFLRYDNFFTGRFDLGNMDQAVWNSLHGRLFQITDPNGTDIISRLSFHADFLLVLLSPFYLIWSHPKMLLVIQSIVLGSGAFFVYLIAKNVLGKKGISLILSFSFLIYPAVNYANLYDFHPVTLATTFLLGAFYFLQRKKYVFLIMFLILAGLSKEEIWFVDALFGGYMILRKKKILGSIIFSISLFMFYFLIWKAIPASRGGQHFALNYYSDFGTTPGSIIKNIVLSPQKTLATLLQKDHLTYLLQIFLPLGFLSLAAPLYLLFSAPDMAINLLSNNTQLHQIYYQYTSAITPFVFISTIYGIQKMKKRFSFLPTHALAIFILITSIVTAYLYGPLPGMRYPNIAMFNQELPDKAIIEDFLSDVPTRYSIAASNNIGSHLSRRKKIYTIPIGIDKADVVLFLLNDQFAQPSLKAQTEMAAKLKNDPNYIEVFAFDDFIVFEKRNVHLQNFFRPKELKMFHFKIPPSRSLM